jgi:hypothetical protein
MIPEIIFIAPDILVLSYPKVPGGNLRLPVCEMVRRCGLIRDNEGVSVKTRTWPQCEPRAQGKKI